MAEIPEEKIAEVRDRTDIVAVIGRVVTLKQAGRSWKGRCPFHQEKTPSFQVDPDRKLYHCFGCKAGGDTIRFVMEYEGRTFPEAVRALAAEAGVEIPDREGPLDPRAAHRKAHRDGLREANGRAAELFAGWLLRDAAGEPGRAHLKERGIGADVARRFGLGYAPLRNDLRNRLVQGGVSEAVLQEAGLLARSERGLYERFRGRLMVPIRDPDGHPIAFGARIVEGDHPAKYLNSPETPLYRKSETLYGFDQARAHIRREGAAVVVEGYFDVIALVQAGIENVVATCGTALTPEHCRLLSRNARDLFLLFDGDAAGIEAAARTHDVVAAVPNLTVRVVRLPDGEDPDTFVRTHGAEAFRTLCEEAVPLTKLLVDRALEGLNRTREDKDRALARVRPILARMVDDSAHRLYVEEIAHRLVLDERTVLAHLKAGGQAPGPQGRREPPQPSERSAPPPADEEALCLLTLEQPALLGSGDLDEVLGELRDARCRDLLTRLLAEYRARQTVDVAGAIERIEDLALRSRWRGHMAQFAELTSANPAGAEDRLEDAGRKLDRVLHRLTRQSENRRQSALAQELAAITDPIERARRLQAQKDETRRRLSKVPT